MSPATKHFARHYLEMVVAMFLGMGVLTLPTAWALSAAGSSWDALGDDAPALHLLLMATIMTGPMVGWMMYRGHGFRANAEMSASMYLPTFAVIGLMGLGMLEGLGAAMVVEHVAMLGCMLAAMLLRYDEYAHHGHHEAVTA